MALDEKTELEYMLLRHYEETGLIGRGFLIRMPFVVLEQIEQNKWGFKIDQNEKYKVRSFIQIDIVSKIMMYIEDLAILSESFMSKRNFYDIVYRSKDLGLVIGSFFERINYISDEEIYKIMSYAAPNQINLDNKLTKILTKQLNSNVKEIRRMLSQIREFGNVHHPLFKRFKHAGMPIFCGHIQSSGHGFFDDFEFCSMISNGLDPFKDVIPIPYSKQALDGYWIVIHGLQLILKDMVTNRIICIQRNLDGLIPNQRYDLANLSSEEVSSMKETIESFYSANPPKVITVTHNYNLAIEKEKISWYLNLSEFLDQCKKRKDMQDKYNTA